MGVLIAFNFSILFIFLLLLSDAFCKIVKSFKRYDELLAAAAPNELRNAGQIYIPPGKFFF